MAIGAGLPLGQRDVEKGRRVEFLRRQLPRLKDLGLVPLVELKGDDMPADDWVADFYQEFEPAGLILTWHPGPKLTNGLAKGELTSELERMGEQGNALRERFGLKAVTIHMAPARADDPPADAGWDRYSSSIGPAEMYDHIQQQLAPLAASNSMMDGILHIETVDITRFRAGGYRLPTGLILQTGAWMDLVWIARRLGLQTTFDREHFLCAGNLLCRREDLAGLWHWEVGRPLVEPTWMDELYEVTGYWLKEGEAPRADKPVSVSRFLSLARPNLYHFGAATRAVTEAGKIGTHLPFDATNRAQMEALDCQLARLLSDGAIGWVVEVTGQLDPGKYDRWSPRQPDDDQAKEDSFDVVLDRMELLRSR